MNGVASPFSRPNCSSAPLIRRAPFKTFKDKRLVKVRVSSGFSWAAPLAAPGFRYGCSAGPPRTGAMNRVPTWLLMLSKRTDGFSPGS